MKGFTGWIVVCPVEGVLLNSLSRTKKDVADFVDINCSDAVVKVRVEPAAPKKGSRKGAR